MKWLSLVFCCAFSSAFSQEVNCEAPYTQHDMNICAYQDYQNEDAQLNEAWGPAMAQMREYDSYVSDADKGAAKSLREAQRAWIKYRDLACEVEGWSFRGGSMEPLIVSTCLASLTNERTRLLRGLVEEIR